MGGKMTIITIRTLYSMRKRRNGHHSRSEQSSLEENKEFWLELIKPSTDL
jgi:hypothetical protein